ncbi:hypothetical protein HGRIS_006376 [Hohenbuehelia grisea]|uniref:Cupredoxin n=1 Tax=Hohenbuehelia grisea TaxID=104357 RepID=A0ABR3JZQ2_9AGAR
MRFSSSIVALGAAALATAQNQVVEVGLTANDPGGIFQFVPNNINATVNSTITFRFTGAPGNHTVTQSSFTNPCDPLAGGFDSGWVFIPPSNVSTAPEWNLTITNGTRPLWFYCKQLLPGPHCNAGMVGAINAPASGANTFDNFMSAARSHSGNSGQGVGALVGQGASASAVPGPITGGAAFTGSPAATPTAPGASGSGGASGANPSSSAPAGNSAISLTDLGMGHVLMAMLSAVAGIAIL